MVLTYTIIIIGEMYMKNFDNKNNKDKFANEFKSDRSNQWLKKKAFKQSSNKNREESKWN